MVDLDGVHFTPVRCGAPNRCDYCAWLSAIETTLALSLDARIGEPPRVGMLLTTRNPNTPAKTIRLGTQQVTRALRRRYPELQYSLFAEWTTGRAATSGGHRRLHLHGMLKGVEYDQVADLDHLVRDIWSGYTGAQYIGFEPLRTVPDAIAYLARHHQKPDQAPPPGWSGRRLRTSRRYFNEPIAQLRAAAQTMIGHDAMVAGIFKDANLSDRPRSPSRRDLESIDVESLTAAIRHRRETHQPPELYKVRETPGGGFQPIGPVR
jgi:hypothetical protein